ANPADGWFLYNIAADPAKKNFCDFPILGFNRNWVVINCNMFNNLTGDFAGGKLFVINKSGLYSNAKPPTVFTFDTQGDSNVTPASTYDNNLDIEYLLEEYDGNLNGFGYLRLWAVTGTVNAPSLVSLALIATQQTW